MQVLVVEDEKDIREALRDVLEYEGFKVFTAGHGREALTMLEQIPRPHLILLDLMMPVMNGWEFVQALNRQTPFASIPIVVITAFAEKATQILPKAVVRKPIDLDLLVSTVRKYCLE